MADERIVAGVRAVREFNRLLRDAMGAKEFRKMQVEKIADAFKEGGPGYAVVVYGVVACGDESDISLARKLRKIIGNARN